MGKTDKKSRSTGKKRSNKWILPAAAGIMAMIALCVVLFIPKGGGQVPAEDVGESESTNPTELTRDGYLVIYADKLSSDKVSFLRISRESKIELLARLGDDGKVKAALGTCQSCNGSPGAYYTQEGSDLKCNNCGLTFPISVLDSPGGGCHPIMISDKIIHYEGNDLLIDLEGLSAYEELFAKVADH